MLWRSIVRPSVVLALTILPGSLAPAALQDSPIGGPAERLERRWFPKGDWWNDPETISRLALDDKTRKKIDDEVFKAQQQMIDLKAEVDRQNLLLERLLQSPVAPKEYEVEAQVDKFVAARGAMFKADILLRARIMGMLTPDQRAELEQLHQERRRRLRDQIEGGPPPAAGETSPPQP